MRNLAPWALAPLAALTLGACNNTDADAAQTEPSDQTLASALNDDSQFGTLDGVVANAGLETVLEGVGPYTVIAPTNDAFTAAGAVDFTSDEMRAQGAELIRAHLLPGSVTREDLIAAIDRGGEAGAQMRTMSDGVLTFTRDGDTIVVAASDGATARFTGDQFLASNGVIQPVDALLVEAAEPTAE